MADDFLNVQLLNDRKLLRDIEAIPDDIRLVIREKTREWTYRMRDLVVQNIQATTKKVTGKLENSPEVEFIENGLRIDGRVYISGVPYARALEKGAQTPPHVIRPANSKVLAFMSARGDKVFAMHVFHPGGRITPRNFMRDAYREMSPKVTRGLYYQIIEKVRRRLRG